MARRRRTFIAAAAFIVLEVAALCCLAYGSELRKTWLVRPFTGISATLWRMGDNVRGYLTLDKENERLIQDNAQLQSRILQLQAGRPAPSVPYTGQSAMVVTMTTGSQHNYIIIDRGSADGISEGDGIITARGAVGIVQATSEHYAFALSFANEKVVVSAKAGREGTVGSLTWTGLALNAALLGGIPVHKDIAPGDTVYTSGYSSIFPPDIPLGIVGQKRINNGSTAEYKVELFEDLSSLHSVTVVHNNAKKEIESLMQ